MDAIPGIEIPPELELCSVERNIEGETNAVFFCKARLRGQQMEVYVKVAKGPLHGLGNERDVLQVLSASGIRVPSVLWYQESPVAFLVLELLPGRMVWDFIDPRRGFYQRSKALDYLRSYGECLARIHGLPLHWSPQKRTRLNGFIGEEAVGDRGFRKLVRWLSSHAPDRREDVFVHGDLNTGSVLFLEGAVSGVVDWEFAGRGWREYDLAWVLRARKAFLQTQAERAAILEGYLRHGSYDEQGLRWCEVLNYLHFAYWNRNCADVSFYIQKALSIVEGGES
jgi:aminoglycoside phosphotransferase (APT) family kinase protein